MIQRYDLKCEWMGGPPKQEQWPVENPCADGTWVTYADHIAALQSVRRVLSEDCADLNCRGTMLEEGGRMRCVQCRKWKTEEEA